MDSELLLNLDSTTGEQNPAELSKLKKNLEGYRQLLLPINKVVEWEQSFYPGIIVGVITFIFMIVWYMDPSALTCICLVGILVCAIDFAVPMVTGILFSSSEWTADKDRQFESICRRLLNAKQHALSARNYLKKIKDEKPKLYPLGMMAAFLAIMWFGSIFNNFFLSYLIIVGLSLAPGARKSGLFDKISKQAADKVAEIKDKAKTN